MQERIGKAECHHRTTVLGGLPKRVGIVYEVWGLTEMPVALGRRACRASPRPAVAGVGTAGSSSWLAVWPGGLGLRPARCTISESTLAAEINRIRGFCGRVLLAAGDEARAAFECQVIP